MSRLFIAFALILSTLSAAAQERPRTILVLDGSGSMWGQIDGVNKIVIAREVIGGLLQDFPPDQELGLTVYGHRRKGDCNDIETVIAPGLGTTGAIAQAVNAINPKGKTPLSASVMAAAEALRYGEEKATVILVSDGIETCNVDPCEVGRTLEATGVDFTAHVVGFDVQNDPQALAQLQCLAEETGGIFRTAANASELTEALQAVSEPPAPEPADTQLAAVEGIGGPQITEGLSWTVTNALGVPILSGVADAAPVLPLDPGDYKAIVRRETDGARAELGFTVAGADQRVVLVLPELVQEVSVGFGATEGIGGPAITEGLSWTVSDATGRPVLSGSTDARPSLMLEPGTYTAAVTRAEDGATAEQRFTVAEEARRVVLVLPEIERPQDVDFVARAGGQTIGDGLAWTVTAGDGATVLQENAASPSARLMPGSYTATVTRGSDGATARRRFSVEDSAQTVVLTLPELPPDPVDVRVFATDGRHGPRIDEPLIWDLDGPDGAILTAEQTPSLDLDLSEGAYTVSVMRPADEAFAEQRFGVGSVDKTVTLELPEFRPLASVTAPDTAVAGDTIQVDWTGPDAHDDYIRVTRPGETDAINYTRTREGTPLRLRMPPEPGQYEISYILRDGRKILATETIEVTPVEATLSVSGDLIAGNTVQIDWTGPDYHDDYISVVETGGTDAINYTRTRSGSPLDLKLPPRPGTYDILYVMRQDRTVLARMTIEVAEVTATLSAPATAATGATVQVDWTGPDYHDDYISVVEPGGTDSINYTRTRSGAPLDLKMPAEPGTYEIVYIMRQDRRQLARRTIEVTDVTATLEVPATATAGETIQVDWTGPDYHDDYISVVEPGGSDAINYTRTRSGSPLDLKLPAEPGSYDIIYVMRQDRTELARVSIEVSEVTATLDAPARATAGETIQVDWTGPDYHDDYISVVEPGGSDAINYTRTRSGSPLDLKLPSEPGSYDIIYVMRQDRTELARISIEVSEIGATLSAPAQATAGETIQVDWTGPDYHDDYIMVTEPGGTDSINYTRTR
ncbi:VWA domain-containing protein, partial [Psychromarinibacter sp. C21-152]